VPAIGVQDAWIRSDGGRLFARRWNAASRNGRAAVVLLHDSLGCIETWRDFPARLASASGREVIAYDRLGFGRSDPHPGRLGFDFVRDEAGSGLRHLREQLQLQRFVAFGHSVGGGMAVAAVARSGADCVAVATESAQAFVEDRTLEGIRAARQAFAGADGLERLASYHGDKAAWVLGAWIDTWLAPEFAGWNLDADLRAVRCPALVLHGDRDEYGSARHPQRIADGVAGPAQTHLLPDCGHVPHRERAEVVLDLVARWLGRLPSEADDAPRDLGDSRS
jgi:pimeloyl-ACP methyl ester carboxylesterase